VESLDPSTTATTTAASATTTTTSSWNFHINVVDIYTLNEQALILRDHDCQSIAEALARNGYLGSTPETPSVAVSFRTLELYYRLRIRKPSFSVEAFAKVVCDHYKVSDQCWLSVHLLTCSKVPYHRRYRLAIANTFDVYLAIQRSVDKQVLHELGRDTHNWRVLNACPPCGYEVCTSYHEINSNLTIDQLENEPDLKFRRMLAVDGNSSLSRVAAIGGRTTSDVRVFEDSDYYLSRSFVDQHAAEVRSTAAASRHVNSNNNSNGNNNNNNNSRRLSEGPDDDGDESEGVGDGCNARRWKAAGEKGTWGIFEESGLFASACRHGFSLWIVDMIRSGEL
jgi:hypothetical protein